MPIDKMIPRFLVSDEDERLLKEGAMTDALNVTISEDGDGSEGVLKNVKGTTAITGATLGIGSDNVKVIGQVSDSQLGYIYFFVATVGQTFVHDAIYRVDTNTNATQLVFKDQKLNFSPSSFLKADVINANTSRGVETLLYFTDNINPPRKINVDRALDGDYNVLSSDELDYAINCIKAAPTAPPTFRFDTDSSFTVNNFKENQFQFACQIVYKDGEESAIGTYSKLAVSRPTIYGGMEVAGYGISDYVDNVCVVNSNVDKNLPDLSSIRILARRGNDGNFFVVDEFDPKLDVIRDVFGTATSIYSASSGEYRFFNDRLGASVDPVLVNKMYDNVPINAESLAIVDNRLMFSNYTEGRGNVDVSSTTMDPVYSAIGTTSDSLITSSEYSSVVTQTSVINISVDSTAASAITTGDVISAGSRLYLNFVFKPTFTATSTSGDLISIPCAQEDQQGNTTITGSLTSANLTFTPLETNTEEYTFEARTPTDFTTTELADYIQGFIEDKSVTLTYSVSSGLLNASGLQNISSANITDSELEVTFKFGEDTTSANDVVVLKPRITRIKMVSIDVDQSLLIVPPQQNILEVDGNAQSEISYSGVSSTYISNQVFKIEEADAEFSFKSGATHNFGVVFYDKYNRSGFVNEIGNVFVEHVSKRSETDDSNKGAAAIKITPSWTNPFWADSYQFVYSGSSVESVTQYTVGNAYPKYKDEPSLSLDTNSKRLYVSLKTLDNYRSEKEVLRDYSFTKGDKLRVINYKDTSGNFVYPKGSGGEVDGEVIEFDIVGVELLALDNEILHSSSNTTHDDFESDPHAGTFLVIESPNIVATSSITTSTDVSKYVGFDWFQVSGTNYNSTVTVNQANYWKQGCVVELVTQKKSTSEKIYYEIGERFNLEKTKEVILDGGDVYYRPVSCKTPYYSSSTWNSESPKLWRYEVRFLEDSSASDIFPSKAWDKGRPHVKYDRAASIRNTNGITYSDKYVIDSESLGLSSFNPSLANFTNTNFKFGAIRYIGNYNDDIVALQENKLSLLPVNKNILEYASGSADVAVSTNVIGQPRYSAGDYGCGNHPEAVLIQDNSVFFVDESRQAVCALTGGQLVPISDKSMSSFFENFFTNSHTKYVSGYDPRDNTYYLTGLGGTDNKYKTIGYDAARGVWQSRYSFTPDIYSNQNNMLYSAKYTSGDNLFWKHDSTTYNSFYGTGYLSEVQMVSKLSPSRVKVFNALSYEGDSALWGVSTDGIETDLGQITDGITEWRKNEGSYYAPMPRNKNTDSTGTNKSTIYLGNLTLVDGFTYSSDLRLNRLPIPTGVTVVIRDLDVPSTYLSVQVSSVSNNQITFSSAVPAAKCQLEITESIANAVYDPMRGHWMKIKMQNSDTTKHELYCINTHITDSKSHHPLGG